MRRSEAKEIFTTGLNVGLTFVTIFYSAHVEFWPCTWIVSFLLIYNIYKAWKIYEKCELDKEIR